MTNDLDRALIAMRVSRDHGHGAVLNDAEVPALLAEIDRLQRTVSELRMAEAEAMSVVLDGEGRIDRLTRERDEARAERDALAKDKARLDWLDAQWRDPIHLEVGARSFLGDGYVRECVLFTPKGDVQGADVRFTIDAQIEQERSDG